MKSFFGADSDAVGAGRPVPADPVPSPDPASSIPNSLLGRIAVYDSLAAAPRVEDVRATDPAALIESLAARVYQLALEQGGAIPYTLIREIVENFIHAHFSEIVVTMMDRGNTIRFSDQGPGIPDKGRAFFPGFTTASGEMKRIIRGVGSGLPIVKEWFAFSDGSIEIEDNLGSGTVVTLRLASAEEVVVEPEQIEEPQPPVQAFPRLSVRQKQVLSLVMELGAVGPSAVQKELGVAVSTAYRDLAFLEDAGLIATDGGGKRALTENGVAVLDDMFNR